MISHLKWMGHSATILEIQKNLRDDLETCEVTLAAGDYSVRAHRFVLSSCSDLLRNVLGDVPLGQEATIVVPDIKGALLDSVLAFIYIGEAQISSTNLSDFLEAINILGIKSAISFECSTLSRQNQTSVPIKAIAGLEIVQEDIIESDNDPKMQSQEYLEMYSDSQAKIHYALEHMSSNNHANEFILTENVGDLYTLTQNAKISASVNTTPATKLTTIVGEDVETEAEGDVEAEEGSIIEELSNSVGENLLEMSTEPTTNASKASSAAIVNVNEIPNNDEIYESGNNARTIKLKESAHHEQQERIQRNKQAKYAAAPVYESNEPNASKEFTIYQQPVAVEISLDCKNDAALTDPLELAVQCVINEGMSLQKAAQKHDISKTVLWRRVRKDPNYQKTTRENPVLVAACERLKHGESMKNISKELDIPMSTLHRHKVRLSLQGRLPKWVTFKRRDANSKDELREKLNKAVHACVHDGMSQNHAANLFEIPKSTLWRHLQKRVADTMASNEIKKEDVLT